MKKPSSFAIGLVLLVTLAAVPSTAHAADVRTAKAVAIASQESVKKAKSQGDVTAANFGNPIRRWYCWVFGC